MAVRSADARNAGRPTNSNGSRRQGLGSLLCSRLELSTCREFHHMFAKHLVLFVLYSDSAVTALRSTREQTADI